jgi:hypothetical protein
MRDIKFRIWEGHNKCFSKTPHSFLLNKNFELSCVDDSFDGESWKFIIEQYTGCLDKNHKEIYEGDVIKYKDKFGQVTFLAGMFVLDWGDQTESELGYLLTDKLEIVGNIHEN